MQLNVMDNICDIDNRCLCSCLLLGCMDWDFVKHFQEHSSTVLHTYYFREHCKADLSFFKGIVGIATELLTSSGTPSLFAGLNGTDILKRVGPKSL